MPKVEWAAEAVDDLKQLDRPVARRIISKINWLSRHFDNITPESLTGSLSGTFKLRVGDWRVIYTLEDGKLVIQAIGHRKEVYE